MNKIRYIYTLVDPTNNEIRYIGQTINPKIRLRDHIQSSLNINNSKYHTHKSNWIRKIHQKGFDPIMEIIDKCTSLNDSNKLEREYITEYYNAGHRLTNSYISDVTEFSNETKKKMSMAKKGKKLDEIVGCSKRADIIKKSISSRMIGNTNNRVNDPIVRRKISDTLKGYLKDKNNHWAYGLKMNEEHKEKLRQSKLNNSKNVGNRYSPSMETREKLRNAISGTSVKKYKILQYDLDMNLIKIWNSIREINREIISMNRKSISDCCKGNRISYAGYIWKYMNKESIIEFISNLSPQQRREHYIKKNYPIILEYINDYNIKFKIMNFSKLLFHYCNENIPYPNLCKVCDNNSKFNGFNVGYNEYCSRKCSMNDIDIIKKRNRKSIETNLRKYGVSNPMKVDYIKKRIINNNLSKYGKQWYFQTDEFINNLKEYNLRKYNKEWYFQTDEFKMKSKKTSIAKLGVEHHTKSKDFIEKVIKMNRKRYGKNYIFETDEYRELMKDYYSSSKFKKNIENQIRSNKKRIFKYYQNYNSEYNLIEIENNNLYYDCPLCGSPFKINKQLLYLRNKNNHICCTICNNPNSMNISYNEKELLSYINSIYFGKIIENYKDVYEVDIYLPELNIGFEFNGLWYHSSKFKDDSYHINYFMLLVIIRLNWILSKYRN